MMVLANHGAGTPSLSFMIAIMSWFVAGNFSDGVSGIAEPQGGQIMR